MTCKQVSAALEDGVMHAVLRLDAGPDQMRLLAAQCACYRHACLSKLCRCLVAALQSLKGSSVLLTGTVLPITDQDPATRHLYELDMQAGLQALYDKISLHTPARSHMRQWPSRPDSPLQQRTA